MSRLKKIFYSILILLIISQVYINSFEDIELICKKNIKEEVFFLNYVSKKNLKSNIYNHNLKFVPKTSRFRRIYLKNFILKVSDPIFNDEYNYKKIGCDKIDNMDIFCVVDFYKTSNGEIKVIYDFYE